MGAMNGEKGYRGRACVRRKEMSLFCAVSRSYPGREISSGESSTEDNNL